MTPPLIPHRIVLGLIVAAILLPVTTCVVFGVASLLGAMGDSTGATVLHRIALGCGIVWAIELITLLLALSVDALRGPDEPDDSQ